jgi:hypothetical protein
MALNLSDLIIQAEGSSLGIWGDGLTWSPYKNSKIWFRNKCSYSVFRRKFTWSADSEVHSGKEGWALQVCKYIYLRVKCSVISFCAKKYWWLHKKNCEHLLTYCELNNFPISSIPQSQLFFLSLYSYLFNLCRYLAYYTVMSSSEFWEWWLHMINPPRITFLRSKLLSVHPKRGSLSYSTKTNCPRLRS